MNTTRAQDVESWPPEYQELLKGILDIIVADALQQRLEQAQHPAEHESAGSWLPGADGKWPTTAMS